MTMYKPRLFPRFSDVLKHNFESGQRFRAQAQGGVSGDRGGDGGGERDGGENRSQVLENSREAAVSQLNREAFNLAASAKDRQAKDEKRRKAVKQKVDLEKRRKQFGSGNIITFLLDVNRGSKPRDIYALEISKLLTHGGFKKEEVVGIKKNEWCSYLIEVHLKEGVVYDCEEIERKIRGQAKLGYTVSKFAYSEDIIKISGIPFHKNEEMVKGLIRESVGPFVQDVLLVDQGKYFEDKMDFFHGKYNGEWKVKVVARVGVLIPTFIIIGKTSKLVAQVQYTKISSDMEQEEICYDCFKPGHKKFSEQCDGPIQVMEFAEEFEQSWKVNQEAKGSDSDINVIENRVSDGNLNGESLKKLEEDLQKQVQACMEKEELLVTSRKEVETLRKELSENLNGVFMDDKGVEASKVHDMESVIKELERKVVEIQGAKEMSDKENEDLLAASSKEVETLRKEISENLNVVNMDEEDVEGNKVRDLEFAIKDLERTVVEMQGSKERSDKEKMDLVENLRTMHRKAFDENKLLADKNKELEKKAEDSIAERADLLDKVDTLSNEVMAVEVVEELLDEVEILAKTVESIARVSNVELGIRNSQLCKNTSVGSLELSFNEGESEEVFNVDENVRMVNGSEKIMDIVTSDGGVGAGVVTDIEEPEEEDNDGSVFNVGEKVIMVNGSEKIMDIVTSDGGVGAGVVTDIEEPEEEDNDGSVFNVGEKVIMVNGSEKIMDIVTSGGGVGVGVVTDIEEPEEEDNDGSVSNVLREIGVKSKLKGVIKKKRKGNHDDENLGVGKKVRSRDFPKENVCIQYLREGKWVTATVLNKAHKSKARKWYNVRHLNKYIVDSCVDLENHNVWRYPEEDIQQVLSVIGEKSLLEKDYMDYGDPLESRGLKSSSPVENTKDCEELMEKNIEAFANLSSIAGEDDGLNVIGEGGTPQNGKKLLSVSQAIKTPMRPFSRGFAFSQGSESDI